MLGTTASGMRSSMPISNHSWALFCSRIGWKMAASSAELTDRVGPSANFGSFSSSGRPSITQNAAHCAGVTTVMPSQPSLVGKLPIG
jgi:hypothetical protein